MLLKIPVYYPQEPDSITPSVNTDTVFPSTDTIPREADSMPTAKTRLQNAMDIFQSIRRKDSLMEQQTLQASGDTPARVTVIPPRPEVPSFTADHFPRYREYPDSVKQEQGLFFLKRTKRDYFCFNESDRDIFRQEKPSATTAQQDVPFFHQTHARNAAFQSGLNKDLILLLVIISLITIAWTKLYFSKFINQIISSLFNFQLSVKLARDKNIFMQRVSFIMNAVFVLVSGIFGYQLMEYFDFSFRPQNDARSILYSSAFFTSLLLARILVLRVTGFIFKNPGIFREYLHQILLICKNAGLYLIPVILTITYLSARYVHWAIFLGLAIFLFGFILRVIRGIQIIIRKGVLIFYLILYLCTLEILPVLYLCKAFFSLK